MATSHAVVVPLCMSLSIFFLGVASVSFSNESHTCYGAFEHARKELFSAEMTKFYI